MKIVNVKEAKILSGEAFLFSLVSLIEKGKQRYNQATKGHQQC